VGALPCLWLDETQSNAGLYLVDVISTLAAYGSSQDYAQRAGLLGELLARAGLQANDLRMVGRSTGTPESQAQWDIRGGLVIDLSADIRSHMRILHDWNNSHLGRYSFAVAATHH
jgi:hypothetical protein